MWTYAYIRLNTLAFFFITMNYKELTQIPKRRNWIKSSLSLRTKRKITEWNYSRVKITDCLRSWLIINVKVKSTVNTTEANLSHCITLYILMWLISICINWFLFFSFHTVNCLSNRKSILITDVCICICVCVRWFIHLIKWTYSIRLLLDIQG